MQTTEVLDKRVAPKSTPEATPDGVTAPSGNVETDGGAPLLTADDLWRLDHKKYRGELVRGVFHEEMPPGARHGEIMVALGAHLYNFVRPRKLGRVAGADVGVWLERDPDTVRGPDVAYFSAEKMPLDVEVVGYAECVPDLVGEVGSPRDSRSKRAERAAMWLSFGARLVWIVHPETKTVDVYRLDTISMAATTAQPEPAATLTDDDTLNGEDVLPGFTCRLTDIFI